MLKEIRSGSLWENRKVTGLEIVLAADGAVRMNVCALEKKKESIVTVFSKAGIEALGELREVVSKKTPVSLVINGKGILHKKLLLSEQDTDKTILQKVLTGANPTDFYLQKVQVFDNQYYVSAVRKDLLDAWLKTLKEEGFWVIDCAMGPFAVNAIVPLILLGDAPADFNLNVGTFQITFGNQGTIEEVQGVSWTASDKTIRVGEEPILADTLLCFAAAFGTLIQNEIRPHASIPYVKQEREEFTEKRKFQRRLYAFAAVLILVLSINFFLSSVYSKEKSALLLQLESGKDALLKLDKLKQKVDEKQLFLEKNDLLQTSRKSWYADQLAADLPEAIQLTRMNINPLQKKKGSEEDKISFDIDHLIVEGFCKKSTELNEWMKIIKNKKWIREVSLLNYSQDKTKEAAEFVISINMN